MRVNMKLVLSGLLFSVAFASGFTCSKDASTATEQTAPAAAPAAEATAPAAPTTEPAAAPAAPAEGQAAPEAAPAH